MELEKEKEVCEKVELLISASFVPDSLGPNEASMNPQLGNLE